MTSHANLMPDTIFTSPETFANVPDFRSGAGRRTWMTRIVPPPDHKAATPPRLDRRAGGFRGLPLQAPRRFPARRSAGTESLPIPH